jgi:methylphosphotriester-DNA--protein-cysteine methyltransferase
MIHYSESLPKENFSDYISERLGYDYTYLANTFSEVKGMTLQHFIIINKVERIKSSFCMMNSILLKSLINSITAVLHIFLTNLKK